MLTVGTYPLLSGIMKSPCHCLPLWKDLHVTYHTLYLYFRIQTSSVDTIKVTHILLQHQVKVVRGEHAEDFQPIHICRSSIFEDAVRAFSKPSFDAAKMFKVRGGQAPSCFSPAIADYLVYNNVRSKPCIDDIPDADVREAMKEVCVQ